jgi:hypothetical protein
MGARNPLRPSPVGPWLSQLGALRNPGCDGDFRDRHDFESLVGQDRQRLVQTRRIDRILSPPMPSSTRVTFSTAGWARSSLIDGNVLPVIRRLDLRPQSSSASRFTAGIEVARIAGHFAPEPRRCLDAFGLAGDFHLGYDEPFVGP